MIGDPGVELLFDNAVYVRGAMTLQALRNEVGDQAFWETIRGWAATKSGGNATSEEFVAYAEEVSGQQLDELFQTWLYSPEKPAPSAVSAPGRATFSTARARARANVAARPTAEAAGAGALLIAPTGVRRPCLRPA